MKEFGLKDEITFGQYKGEIIRDIIKSDPDYIAWCYDEIEWFNLDIEASDALDWALWDIDD